MREIDRQLMTSHLAIGVYSIVLVPFGLRPGTYSLMKRYPFSSAEVSPDTPPRYQLSACIVRSVDTIWVPAAYASATAPWEHRAVSASISGWPDC